MSYSLHYELGYRYDETDSGSELWATRRMTYSDTTKAHLVLKEEFWDAGGATYTLYDPFDQQSWASRVTEIASFVGGDLSSPVTSSVRTNNDDGSYDIVLFDTDGSQDYTQMRTYYAADGTITKVVTNKDDETAVTATYSGGIKTREIAVDGADNFEWASTDTRFDADGDVTKILSTNDDGNLSQERFVDDVKLFEINQDVSDNESWSTQKIRYASNGTDILYVDEMSDAGIRTKHVYDSEFAKAYQTYKSTFTQSGDLFSKVIEFDTGRNLTITYNADGSVASRADIDSGINSNVANAVLNGSFAGGMSNWSGQNATVTNNQGYYFGYGVSLGLGTDDAGWVQQRMSTEAGTHYTVKFLLNIWGDNHSSYTVPAYLDLMVDGVVVDSVETTAFRSKGVTHTASFTANGAQSDVRFVQRTTEIDGNNLDFHLDSVVVKATDFGAYNWASVNTTNDADGVTQSRTKILDDEREVVETFTNGAVSRREETDHDDAKVWTDITTDFDADGKLTDRVLNYDNGRVIDFDYTDGKVTKKSSTDGGDAYTWTSVVDTFDISGDQLSSTQIHDSGRTIEKAFTNGVRSSTTITDTANEHSWANYVYTYEADGTTYATRVVNYDDGSSTTANWENDAWVLV